MPRASMMLAMVFAVNIPLHVPERGMASHSMRCNSSKSIRPAEKEPLASTTLPASSPRWY
jgi:hypothetical protein